MMNKKKILEAAQREHDDEGMRSLIKNSQSLMFFMYSLAIVFLFIVRLIRKESLNDLLLLILSGGLGIEISQFLKRRSLITAFFILLLTIATLYTAIQIVNGK